MQEALSCRFPDSLPAPQDVTQVKGQGEAEQFSEDTYTSFDTSPSTSSVAKTDQLPASSYLYLDVRETTRQEGPRTFFLVRHLLF